MLDGGGLLGGVTANHLRMLCESGWEGGGGYTPEQVGRMTLDQIWFRLCDRELLKREVGGRTEKMETLQALGSIKSEDGKVAGRDREGNPIRGVIRGRSVARQLMEEAAKRESKKKSRKNRKRKNGS